MSVMEKMQLVKTGRQFPLNLYNKLEDKLKRKDIKKDSGLQKQVVTEEDKSLVKCPKCGKMVDKSTVIKRKYVCYECGGYFRVRTKNRIRMVADYNTFEPWFEDMPVSNPLNFEGYEEKLHLVEKFLHIKEKVSQIQETVEQAETIEKHQLIERIESISNEILEEL